VANESATIEVRTWVIAFPPLLPAGSLRLVLAARPCSLSASPGAASRSPGSGFLEFEVEGPYTQIPANGTLPWSLQWRAVKIPSSVTVAVGSATLVTFAQQQAAM
jgi:hypothetical protein